MTPKAVVFDIGNVLIEWNPERLFDAVIGEDARRELFSSVDLHAMNDEVDRGAPFRETVFAMAERNPEHRDNILIWHDRWLDMASPEIAGSWEILRALRNAGIPVFALSNFGVDTFAMAEKHYPSLTEFDRRYISGHLQVTKPDPKIYEIVEEDSGFSGPELLFIDDRNDNIAVAEARGWQGLVFKSPEQLSMALREIGLPV
jgi:2-haloacid dehalogenase